MGSDPIDLIDPRKQPAFNTIQRPPVGGHDVQEYALVGGHLQPISSSFRFLARVTSCVIFKTARFSSIVVLVDSVERLSPIRDRRTAALLFNA